ncbi:MAG: extracellular solute-binding protein [Thermoleophilia bacterium]|nr:extracellular solute-binding protein [Thermoleophilia bacterium]MDH5333780.1 extracellular solute-binding protein [Thermoleophilia bacterium]
MRRRRGKIGAALLLTLVLTIVAAGCGGDDNGGGAGGSEDVSGSIAIQAIWGGTEQESFQAVIDGFTELYPNCTVGYTSGGDNNAQLLATAVEGGNPPDIAAVGQPGLMKDFVDKGALQSLEGIRQDVVDNFGESVAETGSVDGTLYGIMFKGANKSTVWYNVAAFDDAGVSAPETWDDLLADGQTIKDSGLPAYSIGGADGWTLTDLFENVYIRTAGPELYDQLATHEIPWTDQSVKDALAKMADVLGDSSNMAGGTDGALQTDFPTSVGNVFSDSPKAAMVLEGDFVPGVVESTLEPETGYNVFTFPSIDGSAPAVVGGGDLFVQFKTSACGDAFMQYLTTADAAEIWAARGGFSSPNKNLDPSVYPDEITRATAGALGEAETFRFDLSDLQPSAFGGTVGQGLFKLFQDFLANPSDIDGVAQQMEDEAAKAYAG